MITVHVMGSAGNIALPEKNIVAAFVSKTKEDDYVDYEFSVHNIGLALVKLENRGFKFTVQGGN